MPRISMNELTTYRWSFDEDVFHYQQAGFRAIGLWRRKTLDFGEERAVELLAESGLEVTTLFFAGGFTGSDGRTLGESIDDAAEAVRFAAAVDAGSATLFTGGRNHHIARHAERLLHKALEALLPLAETLDVPLALKPKHAACASEWSFLTDLPAALAFIHDYNSPYLKIVYDTYHFPHEIHAPALRDALIPHLALVHVADTCVPRSPDQEQCLLGDGKLPLERSISELLEAGYDGDFDIKLTGPIIEATNYHEILRQSQQSMNQFLSTLAHSQ